MSGAWLDLLKYTIAATPEGFSSSDAPRVPMPAADREWLASALTAMTVDEAARMKELAIALEATVALPLPSDSDARDRAQLLVEPSVAAAEAALAATKLDALDELRDIVESIDNAKNLFFVGGIGPLMDAVRGVAPVIVEGGVGLVVRVSGTSSVALRVRACEVLSTVCQNNPKAQGWALEAGCLPLLLNALRAPLLPDVEGWEEALALRAAALTALSALVRNNGKAQRELMAPRMCNLPLLLIMSPLAEWTGSENSAPLAVRRLVRKALFCLRFLAAGAMPETVLTALLTAPTPPAALPSLLKFLYVEGATTDGADGADVRDARESALSLLESLVSAAVPFEGVIDDSDKRQTQRPLYPSLLQASGGGGGEAAPTSSAPLLLTQQPHSPSERQQEEVEGGAPLPPILSLAARQAALRAAGAPLLLHAHAAWCLALAAALREHDVDDATSYEEEAATCRRIATACASDVD